MFKRFYEIISTIPAIMFVGAIVLFVLGYLSSMLLGPDQIVEELSELILRKHYKIEVEFSPDN